VAGANTVIALRAKIRLKEVFCGICIEKGATSFVGENLKKLDGTVISVAMVPSRRNRSLSE